jgi:hypothetical protein
MPKVYHMTKQRALEGAIEWLQAVLDEGHLDGEQMKRDILSDLAAYRAARDRGSR